MVSSAIFTLDLVGLLPGPLDTKLCQFMSLLRVSLKNYFYANLVPFKEFLDNLGLHLIAKYEVVGLI